MIHVYDGYKGQLDKLAELTGSSVPNSIFSREPAIMLIFISDHSVEERGFKIEYNVGG